MKKQKWSTHVSNLMSAGITVGNINMCEWPIKRKEESSATY